MLKVKIEGGYQGNVNFYPVGSEEKKKNKTKGNSFNNGAAITQNDCEHCVAFQCRKFATEPRYMQHKYIVWFIYIFTQCGL